MANEIERDFDAIIVGAGIAGSVAAYTLAKAGKAVLVIERGAYPGAKNMTGGRIYSHSLWKIFPDFESEAPLGRKITHERVSLMPEEGNFTIDFTNPMLAKEGRDSWSVLRGPFDQWLAGKAEEAGAEIISGIVVDGLLKDEADKIYGITAGGDEMTSHVVLLCDGANSLLVKEAGLTSMDAPLPSEMAVGIKEVIELPAKVIEDRFNVASGEGVAWLTAGYPTGGRFGGVALYTNTDSVSVSIVASLSEIVKGDVPIYQMLADYLARPEIASLLEGGRVVEHSGHIVPEGGYNSLMHMKLVRDGVLAAGDNCYMCVNTGYAVRGMDLAVEAGRLAGEATVHALDTCDTSGACLHGYVDALKESFVLKDMQVVRDFPGYMEWNTRIFREYPDMVRDIFLGMYSFDGTPQVPIKQKIMPIMKKVGMWQLLMDARKGMKAL